MRTAIARAQRQSPQKPPAPFVRSLVGLVNPTGVVSPRKGDEGLRLVFAPGASVLADRVVVTIKHDDDRIIASTENDTLRVAADPDGIRFEIDATRSNPAGAAQFSRVACGLYDQASSTFRELDAHLVVIHRERVLLIEQAEVGEICITDRALFGSYTCVQVHEARRAACA